MGTDLTATQRKTLAKLGRDATKEHRQCAVAGNAMLEHANLCGAYLLQAKETVPHGEWEDWLAEHFSEASPSAARGYMRISDRWAELEQNGNSVADLTVRGALKLLAKPREPALFEAPGPLPLGDEPAATSLVPSQDEPCPNCGATAFDEDGDCLECREPGVRPPEPPQDALDEEEDESPDSPEEAAEQAGASPCKAFLARIEDELRGWVRCHPEDVAEISGWLDTVVIEVESKT